MAAHAANEVNSFTEFSGNSFSSPDNVYVILHKIKLLHTDIKIFKTNVYSIYSILVKFCKTPSRFHLSIILEGQSGLTLSNIE